MEKGITKEQSKMLQGLAILMMLYHHLFSTPEALGVSYKSLLAFGSINFELKLAWFFKICVGIYAFVSGYGLTRGLNSLREQNNLKSKSFGYTLLEEYKYVFRRLLGFMQQYWLVFIVFIPIGFWGFHIPFRWDEFILNFLGISSTYNGVWWYVFFYMKMLIVLPIIDSVFCTYENTKDRFTAIIFGLVIVIILVVGNVTFKTLIIWLSDFFMLPFMECFLVGFILAKFRLVELIGKILPINLCYVLGIIGMILAIAARMKIAKDATSVGLDFLFVPVIAYGFVSLMIMLPKLSCVFAFFGKYSTYIWLTHVFYYGNNLKKYILFSRVSVGIYLTLLVISLITAMLLYKFEDFLRGKIIRY